MKKLLFIFLALLIISSYFISAGITQTGKVTFTVIDNNLDYSSNVTGNVVAETENNVSLLSRIIDFFKGIF